MNILLIDVGSWGDMLVLSGVGFCVVFVLLVLLIFIMKLFGYAFTLEHHITTGSAPKNAVTDEEGEMIAAITTALTLFSTEMHDRESGRLTIKRTQRAYSPWSSKIYGLTQLPEHNTKH